MRLGAKWLGFALLAIAAVARGHRGTEQVRADRIVAEVARRARDVTAGRVDARVLVPYIRGLREARALDPTSVRVRAARGDLFLLLGREESALEAYDDALALEPRAEVWYNRSLALERLGRAVEAAADRERALVVDPRLGAESPARTRERAGEEREVRPPGS